VGFLVQHWGMFGKLYRLVLDNLWIGVWHSTRKWKTTSRWTMEMMQECCHSGSYFKRT